MRTLTVAEARAIDVDAQERLGMPTILLMENAARAVAECARRHGDRFVILAGAGNNGGDGMAAARHLGRAATVHLLDEPSAEHSPDAALQVEILRRAGLPVHLRKLPDPGFDGVWIDAIFGTGLTRIVEGEARQWIEAFNAARGEKISVDIPSGLDGDRGVPLGVACRAHRTVTFVAPKAGMLLPAAKPYVGEIEVAGLGLPPA